MNNSRSFDRCVYPCKQLPCQDAEPFHHPQVARTPSQSAYPSPRGKHCSYSSPIEELCMRLNVGRMEAQHMESFVFACASPPPAGQCHRPPDEESGRLSAPPWLSSPLQRALGWMHLPNPKWVLNRDFSKNLLGSIYNCNAPNEWMAGRTNQNSSWFCRVEGWIDCNVVCRNFLKGRARSIAW